MRHNFLPVGNRDNLAHAYQLRGLVHRDQIQNGNIYKIHWGVFGAGEGGDIENRKWTHRELLEARNSVQLEN
jgi:hypothetical protein